MNFLTNALKRDPDYIIGETKDPYLLRWFIIPKNKFFNIYLHKFCKSDDDRALHDHPWNFNISILLKGSYFEHVFFTENHPSFGTTCKVRKPFRVYFRYGRSPHRIELNKYTAFYYGEFRTVEIPVWTIFITGRVVRAWGFFCPQGWKPWKDFVSVTENGNKAGKGCKD